MKKAVLFITLVCVCLLALAACGKSEGGAVGEINAVFREAAAEVDALTEKLAAADSAELLSELQAGVSAVQTGVFTKLNDVSKKYEDLDLSAIQDELAEAMAVFQESTEKFFEVLMVSYNTLNQSTNEGVED